MAEAATHNRLGDLQSVAAALGWTSVGGPERTEAAPLALLDPDTRALLEPILTARTVTDFYRAKLAVLADKPLIERVLRSLLAEGKEQAIAAGSNRLLPETEIVRISERQLQRVAFLSPAAKETFRDGLRAFRRLILASRASPNYTLAFNADEWIFNYAYIAFAWALVIIKGVRPACDDVPLEVARTFRNITTGAAEALEAIALGQPVDTDLIEDHLDAELLRAEEVLHPEDFKRTRSFASDVAG